MNKTDLINFIIDTLTEQNKLSEYLLWVESIPDENIKFHIMDKEYTIFTHGCILQYLQMCVTDDTYEFLYNLIDTDPELNNFLRVCIDRQLDILYMSNEFYDLFMNEVNKYSANTLK
jgi:hypothetical protein